MKYTPGPWEIDENYIISPLKVSGCRIGGSFQNDIASVCPMPGDEDEQKANIRLIAAAPEIYETLKGLLLLLEYVKDKLPFEKRDGASELIKNAKAIIAKVEAKNEV